MGRGIHEAIEGKKECDGAKYSTKIVQKLHTRLILAIKVLMNMRDSKVALLC